MQLKLIIPSGTFRFHQSGLPVNEITEPFVRVEVNTKEEVTALYDQGGEHLANVFTYDGDQISGIAADAAKHIENFFLAEGAWYLQELNPVEQDIPSGNELTAAQSVPAAEPPAIPANAEPQVPVNPGFFVPNPDQRELLRQIQTTVAALHQIEPDPAASWDRQVQKLLVAQQIFGINDPAQAHAHGQQQLEQLIAQARAAGIPEEVVTSNTTVGTDPEVDELEEEEP